MPLENEGKKTGTRCHVCTGCGRCGLWMDGGGREMRVLLADPLQTSVMPIDNSRRERLVTADIGTTTIAMQLYRPEGIAVADYSCINPQVEYGADVLSRIQAAEDAEIRENMRRAVTAELENGLRRFAAQLEKGESMRMVLAGNTAMIYLLLGYDPAELGRAPFHATHLRTTEVVIGGVPCHIMPGQSAFVGGDITAGIYACGIHEADDLTLLIDLGTNGEMALGNRDRILACATAAGPAFEGGVNRGIWGADMVKIIARLLKEGVVDETGLLAERYFDGGVRISDICVTQNAIRAIQLAKAAIAAGIRILLKEYGFSESEMEHIGRVVLAGGFGYYLDPADAAAIGLLPEELVTRTRAGGNTALRGALRAGRDLLYRMGAEEATAGEAAQSVLGQMERGVAWNLDVLNLAEHPDFEAWYIEEMNF